MKNLSLRIRIFLFFCLTAVGSLTAMVVALTVGYRRLGDPEALSAFVTAGLIAGLGITAVAVFIWLLFDENVSKPVESIAASLRVRAHVGVSTPMEVGTARYLGDLAPAASAMGAVLDGIARKRSEQSESLVTDLTRQRDQLVAILSDIPIATILATSDHEIVLYDGQAAALMERVSPPRLKSSVFDYLEKASVIAALGQMQRDSTGLVPITVNGLCGQIYTGRIRAFGSGGYTLMLEPLAPTAARPLTYDFDLLIRTVEQSPGNTLLRDLVYVVFDSETTGLDPARDEVVQLGAVRVVKGKLVPAETIDTLVRPPIAIPRRSTEVHGIDMDMVADAPSFDVVCARLHGFASGAILVAHNAAFDMAFVQRQARKSGVAFDHEVLDTVLMSAVVFGGSAEHTLDAICDRLGIVIPADKRHTALGDALATARALVAMIPILEGRGIETLGALRDETERHRRILQG